MSHQTTETVYACTCARMTLGKNEFAVGDSSRTGIPDQPTSETYYAVKHLEQENVGWTKASS